MSPGVLELTAALDEETRLARELVEVLQQDQKRVVERDVEGLEKSNREKEELVLRLHGVETTRRELVATLAARLGLDPQHARVAAICERLGSEGAPLETAAQNLRAVLSSLQELVAVGRGFLEQSILGIRSLLSLIQSLRTPEPQTYDASGRFERRDDADAIAVRREV